MAFGSMRNAGLPRTARPSWWKCQPRFLRGVIVAMTIAFAFLVIVGIWNNWKQANEPEALLRRMEAAVSSRLWKINEESRQLKSSEILSRVRDLDAALGKWTVRFQRDDVTSNREVMVKLGKLDDLQETVRGWLRFLDPTSLDVGGSMEERKESFRRSLARELDAKEGKGRAVRPKWPKPEAPGGPNVALVVARQMLSGGGYGALWPFKVFRRSLDLYYRNRSGEQCSFSLAVRRLLYPSWEWGGGVTLPWLVGMGLVSIGVGYWLCHMGMTFDNSFLSGLGLLFFLHMIVFGVLLGCDIAEWL